MTEDKAYTYIDTMLKRRNDIWESIRMMRYTMLPTAKDDVIESESLKCKGYESVGTGGKGIPRENLTDIINRYEKAMADEEDSLNAARSDIAWQEQEVAYFDATVRRLEDPARSVIIALYYMDMNWQSYQAGVKTKKKPSKSMIFKLRKEGMECLAKYYCKEEKAKMYIMHSRLQSITKRS